MNATIRGRLARRLLRKDTHIGKDGGDIVIHADALRKGGIDYDAGLKRFMGKAELYEMVLAAFVRADIAGRAKAAYDANDRDALLKAVHEAKGSSGNAGLISLYAEADSLVQLLRSKEYSDDELADAYKRFEETYLSIQAVIRESLM